MSDSILRLQLLGTPTVELNGEPVDGFRSTKAQALLYYLVVTNRKHLRSTLAGLLWADVGESYARKSLTQALSNLRQLLGHHLIIDRQSASFNSQSHYEMDLSELDRGLIPTPVQEHTDPPTDFERMRAAVANYRGHFLEGFYIQDAPEFEQWVLMERTQIQEHLLQVFQALAQHDAAQGDLPRAIAHCQQILSIEPWREESHRQLMGYFAQNGQRSAALSQFERCQAALAEELGVAPDPTTIKLLEQIRSGEFGEAWSVEPQSVSTQPGSPTIAFPDSDSSPHSPGQDEQDESSLDTPSLDSAAIPSQMTLLSSMRSPDFVGREDALALLEERLVGLHQGEGALILIEGEAGIGKTTLAQQLGKQATAQGVYFAVGRSYEHGIAPVFAPWLELFAELFADSSFPGQIQASLPPPFGQGEPASDAYQLMQSIADRLATIASSQPLIFLLDDVHWADSHSLDLLDFVTRRIENRSILVLVTFRGEELSRSHSLYNLLPQIRRNRPAESVRLAPLTVQEMSRVVEGRLGLCSHELALYVHERSEGNPLFLVELLNDLIDQDALTKNSRGQWQPPIQEIPVPALLQQLITQRIAHLGEGPEAMLTVASIAGEIWELALVEAVLDWGEEPLLESLDTLLQSNVITPVDEREERYRFSHGLWRETLYNLQLGRIRRRRHAKIGAVLETWSESSQNPDAYVTKLAYHFDAAGDWAKALRYTREAGDVASRRFNGYAAYQFYEQAIHIAQKNAPEIEPTITTNLYERLGDSYLLLNRKDEAEKAFHLMIEAAQEGGDPWAESRGLAQLSSIQAGLDRLDESRQSGIMALHLAEQLGDQKLLAASHYHLGHIDAVVGQLESAQNHLAMAEHLALETETPRLLARSHQNQVYLAIWTGQYQRAEEIAASAVRAARSARDGLALNGARWVLGLSQIELGNYMQAHKTLQSALDHAKESGEQHYMVKLLNTMGYLFSELGAPAEALLWDQQALEHCPKDNINRNLEAQHYTLLNLATDALQAGRLGLTSEYLGEFEAIHKTLFAHFRYINRYHLLQAEFALARQEPDEALNYLSEAQTLAEAKSMKKNILKCHWLRGQALMMKSCSEPSITALKQAVALADQLKHGSLHWKSRLALINVYKLEGRPFQDLLHQAHEQLRSIVNNLSDETLRRHFLNGSQVIELQTVQSQTTESKVTQSQATQSQTTESQTNA
ncbi:MAG: BTAD domain-containing putative transcriptional regulator [Chloroflexota bacterium]